jgi:phosphatidylglycerophosphatase B
MSGNQEASTLKVFTHAGLQVLLTWSLILPAFFIPVIDSTMPPYFDLSQGHVDLAYWLSESGGKYGATLVGLIMLVILISRDGIYASRRKKEAIVMLLSAVFFVGGGATINEHFIKAQLKVPRPNIIWLAGENGNGPLGMTAQEFYELGDKETRRSPLANILQRDPEPVPLSSSIEAHWIQETGYSFPSGHSFSAMFFATFFLAIGVTYLTTKRLWLFYMLLPWAWAVCYSRPILRVHTPADITIGGLQGIVVGFLAWTVARALIRRIG